MNSGNDNNDGVGCGIYIAGSVLAFMIAVAQGGSILLAVLFSWLYVLYGIIELIFG